MSINENQEFEAINKKVKERTESVEESRQSAAGTYHDVQVRKKAKAILYMVAITVAFVLAIVVINALEVIGWINNSFKVVMMVAAGGVAMFNQGYLWHEFKQ